MICLVATVKATRSDLEKFVAYYINIGIAHIYLFFDDPEDTVRSAFVGMTPVTVTAWTLAERQAVGLTFENGIEVRQIYNAGVAMRWARARGAKWLLHVDSDELIHVPGKDIGRWLSNRQANYDAVTFPVLEAIPRVSGHRHPFEACRLFKTNNSSDPWRLELAAKFGCRRALRYGYFRGHTIGKTATRVGPDIDYVGVHFPVRSARPPLRIETAVDAVVLHYD